MKPFKTNRKGEGSSKIHDKIKERVIDGGGSFKGGYALHGAFPGKFAGEEHIKSQNVKGTGV